MKKLFYVLGAMFIAGMTMFATSCDKKKNCECDTEGTKTVFTPEDLDAADMSCSEMEKYLNSMGMGIVKTTCKEVKK